MSVVVWVVGVVLSQLGLVVCADRVAVGAVRLFDVQSVMW